MTAPTLHERRPDAEVVVYGDDAPISDAEWHCARLVFALRSGPLTIAPVSDGFRATAWLDGGGSTSATYPTRAEAVAALTRMAATDTNRAKARAARLRALLGDDRGR